MKNNNGFTLIEMLITVAVITVVLVGVVLGLNRIRDRESLDTGIIEFSTELRNVQNLAYTNQIFELSDGVPDRGYGIEYEFPGGTSYKTFANNFDVEGLVLFSEVDESDKMIEDILLPDKITFNNCGDDLPMQECLLEEPCTCTIVFLPGEDSPIVNTEVSGQDDEGEYIFTLYDNRSGAEKITKNVIIKKWTGFIYYDE